MPLSFCYPYFLSMMIQVPMWLLFLFWLFFSLDCCVFLPNFWNIVGTFILNSLSGNSSNLFLGDMCDAWGFYYFFFMWLLRFYCALYIIYSKWFVEIMWGLSLCFFLLWQLFLPGTSYVSILEFSSLIKNKRSWVESPCESLSMSTQKLGVLHWLSSNGKPWCWFPDSTSQF